MSENQSFSEQKTMITTNSQGTHQNDCDGKNEKNAAKREDITEFIQEQIEKEPIDIKDEPFDSDDGEMVADAITDSSGNKSDKPSPSRKDCNAVETIANKCYICDNVFESNNEFIEHLESHKNMLPYECLPCSTEAKNIKVYSWTALNKHFERHGFNYLCTHCPLRYRTSVALQHHIQHTHEEPKSKYHCETCGKVFNHEIVYLNHMNAHRNQAMERYKCEPCGKVFAWKRILAEHKKSYTCLRNTEKQAQLENTTKERKSQDEMDIEAGDQTITKNSQANNEKIVKQNETHEGYSLFVEMEQDDLEQNNAANVNHDDEISRFAYEQITQDPLEIKEEPFKLDNEKSTAHRKRINQQYKCEPCKKVFVLKVGLVNHQSSNLCIRNREMILPRKAIADKTPTVEGENVENRHQNHDENVTSNQQPMPQVPIDIKPEPEPQPFDTNDGEKDNDGTTGSYENDSNSQAQRKKRPRVQKFLTTKCYICDAIFKTKSDLNDHLESHKKMLPHRCSQCSTEAHPIIITTVVLLNKHFQTHGFHYVCPGCPSRYRTMYALSHHIWNVHENNFEQTCETCGKLFVCKNSFKRHLIGHSNINAERFKCETCQKKFPTKQCLIMHEARHKNKQSLFVSEPAKELDSDTASADSNSREGEHKTLEQNSDDNCGNQNSVVKAEPNEDQHKIKQQYKCEPCQKSFPSKRTLEDHESSDRCVRIEQRVLDVPEEPKQPTFSDQPEAKDYKETQITHSVTSVQEGAMSMSFATKYFGVPRTTLQYRLSAKCKHRGKIGPYTVFTMAEEQDIVAWLKTMERKGFPVTRSALTYKITSLLETNPRKNPFKNNVPGYGWFRGFLKRHPQLTIRTQESLTLASAKISEKNIREWFQTVKQYLVDHGLIDILMDPSRVLNGDELGFHLNPNSKKIVATSVAENFPFDEMDNSKQNITVFFTFCADGSAVPPDVILPHKKPNKATIEAFPEDWGIGSSEYGWMDTNNFVLYINKIVYPFLVRKGVTFPVIYFVDGRKSHTVLEAADACKRLGIILIALYRNSTKILQPAYVGILKPLRAKWFDVVEAWKQQDRSAAVTLTKFGSLLKSAMDSSLTASTIISAFAACGLHPYNPDAVDYSNCNAELYQDDSVAPGTPSDTDSGVADKSAKPDIVVPHDVVEKTLEMLGPAKIQLFRDENHENLSHDDRILAFVYKNILCRTNGASNASDDAATKL